MKAKTKTYYKKKAWTAFSKYIRNRYAPDGNDICVTCGRVYPTTALQAGHWLPNRHNSVLFDERNCHSQCYGCNVGKKGNPVAYFHFMEDRYGREVMAELEELDRTMVQFKAIDYQEIEEKYKQKLLALNG